MVLNTHCIRAVRCGVEDEPCDALSYPIKNCVPFLQGVKIACHLCKGKESRKHHELVHGGIPLLCIKASFKGTTETPGGDPVCYLDEACRSEFMKSSARAAFQQGGVCSFSPKQQNKIKAFYFHGLQCGFLLFLFNGLQHKRCSTKRSWYSEANQTKALLDRARLYLLSEPYLSPLAFCAAVGSMCKSRKALQRQGKPRRQLIHLETAQPKQSPVTWTIYTESLGNCAANSSSGLGFYE